MDEVTKAAKLIGADPDFFVDTFMKPKLKVGKDYVKKGQNKDQVAFAISGKKTKSAKTSCELRLE